MTHKKAYVVTIVMLIMLIIIAVVVYVCFFQSDEHVFEGTLVLRELMAGRG